MGTGETTDMKQVVLITSGDHVIPTNLLSTLTHTHAQAHRHVNLSPLCALLILVKHLHPLG